MNDNSKKTNRLIESGKVVDHNQRVESVLARWRLRKTENLFGFGSFRGPPCTSASANPRPLGSWYKTKAFPANAANQYPYLGRFSEGTSRVLH